MDAFRKYAEYYDVIYSDKDYQGEVDFIEEIFRKFSLRPVKTVLDGGCGTGGHDIPLAERGYEVTGIDISEVMLTSAREKAKRANLSLALEVMDLCRFDLKQKFDAALCMFAVMGYITQTGDLLQALRNMRRHLEKGSLFIFDCWNGLAVLRTLPSVRVKIMESESKRVIRVVHPELDSFNHLCKNYYHLFILDGNTVIEEIKETHIMRYFFPQEIAHYLEETGFELLQISPFLDLDGKADENVWNIAVIARAK